MHGDPPKEKNYKMIVQEKSKKGEKRKKQHKKRKNLKGENSEIFTIHGKNVDNRCGFVDKMCINGSF